MESSAWLVLTICQRRGAEVPSEVIASLQPPPLQSRTVSWLSARRSHGPLARRSRHLALALSSADSLPQAATFLSLYTVKRVVDAAAWGVDHLRETRPWEPSRSSS